MKLKKGDFVELDFVARIKETNQIFDLTDERVAKENKLYNEKIKYKPLIICVGYNDVVKGLDQSLIGKGLREYKIEVEPEDGFGKKKHELIKLVSTSAFTKQDIRPVPGLQINIEGLIGVIKTVGGGRTLVDFNHPLAGKTLVYDIKINRLVKDVKEKLTSFLNLKAIKPEFKLEKDKVVINVDLNKKFKENLVAEIKKRIKEIKIVRFKKQLLKNK